MGQVIKMRGRDLGKTTQMLIGAIEAEQENEARGNHNVTVLLVASDDARKADMQRQLQCLLGLKPTHIVIKSYADLLAERRAAQGNQPSPAP